MKDGRLNKQFEQLMQESFSPQTFMSSVERDVWQANTREDIVDANITCRVVAGISGFVSTLGAGALIMGMHAPTESIAQMDADVGVFSGVGGLVLGGIALAARLKAYGLYRRLQ